MRHNSVCPTPAIVERHHRLAAHSAALFSQAMLLHPVLLHRWRAYTTRHHQLLHSESARHNFEKMMIVFYLAAGLVQGVFLYHMVDATFFDSIPDGQYWYVLVSLLAAIAPLGCSLLAGYYYRNIRISRDPVVYGHFHITWGALLAFFFIGGVYLIFVCLLASFFSHEGLDGLILVPLLAVIELILGIPAASGLSVLILETTERLYYKQVLHNSKAMFRWAEKSATHYRYYELCRNLFNRQHPDLSVELLISPQIERAIQFYEGRWGNDSPPQLPSE